jgi:Tol biopolymer transport system component
MRHRTKWLTAVALCAGMALSASHAQAKVPGPNGRIAFSRYVQDDNTVTYTVNPDGSHMQQLFPGFSGGPRWSPDGSQVSLLAPCTDGEENCAATIVDPDTGTFRQFKRPDPDLETNCTGWSPDGTRLLCDSFGVTDPSRNGIYTILASDGRGLSRITSNPGGEDIPGDYAPDGKRLVFSRTDPSRPTNANVALFVVNVDRTGLRRITPWGLPFWEDAGRWSPDGSTILFDDQRSLFVVHPDGSGMAKIPLVTRGFSRLQNPNWSPDGTKIVVSLFKATSSGTGQAGIYTANADGSDLQQVTGSPTFDRDGDWGPHPLAPSGQNDTIQSSHERPDR